MDIAEPRVFFSTAPVAGRVFGQGEETELRFLIEERFPTIHVREVDDGADWLIFQLGETVLVQLFDRPEVLWLLSATMLKGVTVMMFTPVKLESLDGTSIPELASVRPEAIEAARLQADFDRSDLKGDSEEGQ